MSLWRRVLEYDQAERKAKVGILREIVQGIVTNPQARAAVLVLLGVIGTIIARHLGVSLP